METINLNKISLEELIKKRETEMEENNIDDNEIMYYNNLKEFNNEIEKLLKKRADEYKNINKYEDFDFNIESEDNSLKYFIEFNDQKLEIDNTFILESNPPILVFSNKLDDNFINVNYDEIFENNQLLNPVFFKIKLNGKEFEYKFDTVDEIISENNYDERFDYLDSDSINYRREKIFLSFKISDNSYENMRKDDNYRRMIFAKYKDKLVFREGSFRMINDDLYKEMYNNI